MGTSGNSLFWLSLGYFCISMAYQWGQTPLRHDYLTLSEGNMQSASVQAPATAANSILAASSQQTGSNTWQGSVIFIAVKAPASVVTRPRALAKRAGTLVWSWQSQVFGEIPPNEDVDGMPERHPNPTLPEQYWIGRRALLIIIFGTMIRQQEGMCRLIRLGWGH